uniref:Uncharacterized protein n=1 Tax=Candidatus Kentrum sp. LFY TaxID=2126342 RepID=A0A450V8T2_9GAMM|nr:MAG: hypothetical protein BECKLFY1418A_GA0070994_113710 [Candidatus Kentron sp. LFY]
MTERGAEQPMEVSARDPRMFGGTERGRDIVCQADTAWSGVSGERLPVTMEEVLRRENMLGAYERVKGNQGSMVVVGSKTWRPIFGSTGPLFGKNYSVARISRNRYGR